MISALRIVFLLVCMVGVISIASVVVDKKIPYVLNLDRSINMLFPTGRNSMGSSFRILYKNKFYHVSNSHVCDKALEGTLAQYGLLYNEKIIMTAIDIENDLCVIKAKKSPYFLKLGKNPVKGQTLFYLGYPRKIKFLGSGIFLKYKDIYVHAPETSVMCNHKDVSPIPHQKLCVRTMRDVGVSTLITAPGASGSPVLDTRGYVVGIVFASNGSFIKVSKLKSFIDRIEQ